MLKRLMRRRSKAAAIRIGTDLIIRIVTESKIRIENDVQVVH